MTGWTLWGYHPAYTGPAGIVPIKLTSGTIGHVNTEQRWRKHNGGWILATYPAGKPPMELRDQCRQRHGTPAYLCDPTRPGPEDETHRRTCDICAAYYGYRKEQK